MKVIASLAAVAFIASAGAATAQDMRVAWGDLDLGSPAGVEAFDKRVEAASQRFCRRPQRASSLIPRPQECREMVRRAAVAQLPRITQLDYAQARGPLSI